MLKNLMGKTLTVPEGYILVTEPDVGNIEVGDIAIQRDFDQRPVVQYAHLPDDMIDGYVCVVGLKGLEPMSMTEDLRFNADEETESDIIGLLKPRLKPLKLGSSTETLYAVAYRNSPAHPVFLDLDGLHYQDPNDPSVFRYTSLREAIHLRQRIADAELYPIDTMMVIEIVNSVECYPVAHEDDESTSTVPMPLDRGSIVDLSDGSTVEVISATLSTSTLDSHRLGVTFDYGDGEITAWYDQDGYTNHPTQLHIKKIRLF